MQEGAPMQRWFQALSSKLMPGQGLQTGYRPGGRRRASPRLEVLEDRTLPATGVLQLAGLLTAAPVARVAVSSDEIKISSIDPASVFPDGIHPTVVASPGLDKLLEDIQNLATPPSPLTARFTLLFRAVGARPLSEKPVSPGSGPGSGDGELLAFQTDTANLLGRPNSPGSVSRPGKNVVQPGADSTIGYAAGAEPGRMPHARPAGAPDVSGPYGIPAESPTGFLDSLAHIDDNVRQVGPSQVTGAAYARPAPANANPAGLETNEFVSPSGQAGMAESPTARTDIGRLPADLPDGVLLERFVARQEQLAFTALVERYEGIVLGICQRVLGDSPVAMDAVQATFLVLARKADMLDKKGSLAGWLWKVAYRVALRLRAVAARQRRCEKQAVSRRPTAEASTCAAAIEKQEMLEALNEELQRMPQKYRVPLVLCYIEGRTHAEAARTIGLPRGSMAKRIAEGLRWLRERLLDRGFLC
jgi:RNA polymerase sigma factor (sigma-70 family)